MTFEPFEHSTIIVVDDNSAYLTICKKLLGKIYDVYTVLSAQKMFELMEKVNPDLILLDVLMPDINGYDAIKTLKQDDRYKDIPVIFLTGVNDVQNEIEGYELGAADYILKPFNHSLLRRRINTHLTLTRNYRSIKQAEACKKDVASRIRGLIDILDTGDIDGVRSGLDDLLGVVDGG